ncbi:MAG: hypothetical protein AAFU64_19120, partial [Bacteroidota bacterium]
MPITEKYLPYMLAILLPGLNVVNVSIIRGDGLIWDTLLVKWLIISLAIIGLWKLSYFFISTPKPPLFSRNKYLTYFIVIIVNVLYINLFILFQYILPLKYTIGLEFPLWL